MEQPTSFLCEIDESTGIVTITFNRPQRLNALTFEVYDELHRAFRALDGEPGVRAIVITGAGQAFCSGGDVDEIIGPLLGRDHEGLLDFTRTTCDLVLAMRRCRHPILAAVNGTAAGAGAVIAAACDLRIAAASARIAFLFTRVGLSGADMGAAWLLPRIVGLGRATELLMSGDFITAEEACRIGLYNEVVPDERFAAAVRARAEKLAQGPAVALQMTKRALEDESSLDLETALRLEAQIQADLMLGSEFRQAYEAFRSRRPRPR